ncbi:MAG: hypothetical protein C4581_00085 [Nitrospiraceae bacterium]|nr:MAG: hypothetical protein C4581_00085 [Nitrospiraceae bacterium]
MITIDARGCDCPEAFRRLHNGMLAIGEADDDLVFLTYSHSISNLVRKFVEDFYGCQTMLEVTDGHFSIIISSVFSKRDEEGGHDILIALNFN